MKELLKDFFFKLIFNTSLAFLLVHTRKVFFRLLPTPTIQNSFHVYNFLAFVYAHDASVVATLPMEVFFWECMPPRLKAWSTIAVFSIWLDALFATRRARVLFLLLEIIHTTTVSHRLVSAMIHSILRLMCTVVFSMIIFCIKGIKKSLFKLLCGIIMYRTSTFNYFLLLFRLYMQSKWMSLRKTLELI